MTLLDTLSHIQSIIKKNPALLGHTSVKKAYDALEKAAGSFEKAASPLEDIRYSDYVELKAALKGKTSKTALSVTNRLLEKFGLVITTDAKGKALVEPFLIKACKTNRVGEIIKEINKKPEDIYSDQFFRMVEMNDGKIRNHIERTFSDAELKKFMKANSIKAGKRKNKYSREESIENIMYKIAEARSRIR